MNKRSADELADEIEQLDAEIDVEDYPAEGPDVAPTGREAQQLEGQRERRHTIALETEFSPNTLVGSWALYHNRDQTRQILVVAEPQAGVYLVEHYDLVTDEAREQTLLPLDAFAKVDDEGRAWQFYDDRTSVRQAIRRLMK